MQIFSFREKYIYIYKYKNSGTCEQILFRKIITIQGESVEVVTTEAFSESSDNQDIILAKDRKCDMKEYAVVNGNSFF